MATIDQRGFDDDGSSNLSVGGVTTHVGDVTNKGRVINIGQFVAQAQSAWYVSWLTGNDNNTGVDAQHPVKTIMGGVVARWGTTDPILGQNTIIYVLDSQPLAGEQIVLRPIMVGGSYFGIVGTPSLVAAFNLGTITAKHRPSPTVLLQSTGFSAAGLAAGQLVVNNTRGSRALIYALSGSTATLSQPITSQTIANITNFPSAMPAEDDSWATGNSVSVFSLPLLNLNVLRPTGGETNGSATGGAMWTQYVYIPDQSGAPGSSGFCVESLDITPSYVDCSISPYIICGNGGSGVSSKLFINCALNSGGSFIDCTVWAGYDITYGLGIGDYASIDGDHISGGGVYGSLSGRSFIGAVYLSAPFNIYGKHTAKLDSAWGVGPFVYGQGTYSVADGCAMELGSGAWVNQLLLGGAGTLDGGTTMSTYATGSWHDGVTLNAANLDLYDGGQNPRTGSRFFKGTG